VPKGGREKFLELFNFEMGHFDLRSGILTYLF